MLTNEEILALDSCYIKNCTATQIRFSFGIDADSRFYVSKEIILTVSDLENGANPCVSFRNSEFDVDVRVRAIVDDVLYFTFFESSTVCKVKYGDFHYSNWRLKTEGAASGGLEIRLL